MLIVNCKEHFDTVKAFASKVGLADNLQKNLDYLDKYAEHGDRGKTRCRLYKDFAPYSFEFLMELKDPNGVYIRWFNGGLIYFGDGDTGCDYPQYTTRIGDKSAGWSIHT